MKMWIGCGALFFAFLIGSLVGLGLSVLDAREVRYIDRQTAIRYGLDYAEELCRREAARVADCSFKLGKIERENKDGWVFSFWSPDGKRSIGMIVDRRGEAEVEPAWTSPPSGTANQREPAG